MLSALKIAMIAHDVNRAYAKYALGDDSINTWSCSPKWERLSVVDGVNFQLTRPRTPEENHAQWLAHKVAKGWKYAPFKDAMKKEHPCMLPWDKLPETQKLKDRLFCAVVETLKGAK